MPYIDFKSVVKKVNLKPGGTKEIVLEVSDAGLKGKLDMLSEMIDCRVDVSIESLVVSYNVTINANTNKPITSYKVDDTGVVSEVKPEGQQLEADLGLPPETVPTKEQTEQAELELIDEFITSRLSPTYDDLPYYFPSIIKRKAEGETYMKMASELDISSGKIVELVDEYRKRVAPLAIKWDEWRNGRAKPKATKDNEEKLVVQEEVQATVNDQEPAAADGKAESDSDEFAIFDDSKEDEDDSLPVFGETSEESNDSENIVSYPDDKKPEASSDKEALETFILSGQAPVFEEITFDFPALLARRRNGETWIKIAASINTSSTKLQSAWTKYKKLVSEHMAKKNGEEPGAA